MAFTLLFVNAPKKFASFPFLLILCACNLSCDESFGNGPFGKCKYQIAICDDFLNRSKYHAINWERADGDAQF